MRRSRGRTDSIITKDGKKIALAATAAPATPASLYPTKAASISTGPGVSCPERKAVDKFLRRQPGALVNHLVLNECQHGKPAAKRQGTYLEEEYTETP